MIVIRHRFIAGRGPASGGKGVSISKALAHMKYIKHRPGADREKGGREMFNEHDNVSSREIRTSIKEMKGARVVVHKVTLAPEINPSDKKAFTREVMQNLGRDKGLDLIWFAVEHSNTEHHHIHVVVLGKDLHGTDVRLDLKDIDKVKDYGDRYLERAQPREFEQARKAREERENDYREKRNKEREVARGEREREGLELPWMHKKIVREQLEPYRNWKEQQTREQPLMATERIDQRVALERSSEKNTIEAAGKQWSKANSLEELRELNQYLWDNYEERIEKDEYKKLVAWIHSKEEQEQKPANEEKEPKAPEKDKPEPEKDRSEFEFKGEKYSKNDTYEKLTGLTKKLREGEERLPFDDYQNLRNWIEDRDRQRWSGALEKQIELVHKKLERSKTMEDLKMAEGGRVLNPLQDQLMRNPIVGLFMTEASIANELVRSIVLDDRNRDYLKEGRDELEEGKKGLDEKEKKRSDLAKTIDPADLSKLDAQDQKDRESREKIEKAIESNKDAKDRERKKATEKRDDKERDEDWDRFDPWGRY